MVTACAAVVTGFVCSKRAPVVSASSTEPASWPADTLPGHLYRTGATDLPVRVGFPFPLSPTADPLVWNYHPGYPAEHTPPSYRIHFAEPPRLPPAGQPIVITGFALFEPDTLRRINGLPGVALVRAARLAPATLAAPDAHDLPGPSVPADRP